MLNLTPDILLFKNILKSLLNEKVKRSNKFHKGLNLLSSRAGSVYAFGLSIVGIAEKKMHSGRRGACVL